MLSLVTVPEQLQWNRHWNSFSVSRISSSLLCTGFIINDIGASEVNANSVYMYVCLFIWHQPTSKCTCPRAMHKCSRACLFCSISHNTQHSTSMAHWVCILYAATACREECQNGGTCYGVHYCYCQPNFFGRFCETYNGRTYTQPFLCVML